MRSILLTVALVIVSFSLRAIDLGENFFDTLSVKQSNELELASDGFAFSKTDVPKLRYEDGAYLEYESPFICQIGLGMSRPEHRVIYIVQHLKDVRVWVPIDGAPKRTRYWIASL